MMSERRKSKSSRKRFVKVALVAGVRAIVSLGIRYYSFPTDSDILVLDKSVLTAVLNDIPKDE
jgi:hypothetical protein